MQKMGSRLKELFDIIPLTFALPKEYINFSEAFYNNLDRIGPELNLWIIKPIGKSRGRGISVVNSIENVVYSE